LAGRLLAAQEEERRHLARELHDDVTQRLAVLAIDAGLLVRGESVPEPVQPKLEGMRDALVALSSDVHSLSRQLHPAVLDDLGLAQALRSECARVSQQEGIRVDCDVDGVPDDTPDDVALCTYRVAQEALRNIVKHACAEQVSVTLRCEKGCLVLHVSDTGVGFDPELRSDDYTLGLASMAERARLINAKFRVDSQPGAGTTIELQSPLPEVQDG
jgi:signal transduction histidine kinase